MGFPKIGVAHILIIFNHPFLERMFPNRNHAAFLGYLLWLRKSPHLGHLETPHHPPGQTASPRLARSLELRWGWWMKTVRKKPEEDGELVGQTMGKPWESGDLMGILMDIYGYECDFMGWFKDFDSGRLSGCYWNWPIYGWISHRDGDFRMLKFQGHGFEWECDESVV